MSISPSHRIATLDGWRGVAILMVVVNHVAGAKFAYQTWASLGQLGVNIFFVLSGYIITARLLDEQAKTSTISLRRFYIRRVFRILPPVIFYLSVLLVLSQFLAMDVRISDLIGSLFFFRNYQLAFNMRGVYTLHFWSLSIEEHFYLLWPLFLLRLGSRRALWLAPGAAIACAVWKLYDYAHPDNPIGRLLPGVTPNLRLFRTDMQADGLLYGCAVALLLTHEPARRFIERNVPKETPLICSVLIVLTLQGSSSYASLATYPLVAIAVASTLVVQEGLAYKWLNWRWLTATGLISYSLYIWQQLFLIRPDPTPPMGILSYFPFNVLCAFTMACLSYFCIERPAIRLGHRISRRPPSLVEPGSPIQPV